MRAPRAAVCTNRPPAAIAGCLRAIAADGAGDGALLVLSGVSDADAAAHRAALAAALPGAEAIRVPEPGLSRARNAAAAACAPDEVVAYVDDDAEVWRGWGAALTGAWRAAGPRVGCLGGPIHARFPAGRPTWLGDGIVPMLTALDYGPEPHALDPRRRALAGANVSFLVAALREAGGFEERWGPTGAKPWFGDDDEAQIALVRHGWEVGYVPGAGVDHIVSAARARPVALVRRRFRHGAAMARRGHRPRRVAARWLASNALLAPVALARGDRARAMERVLHASENLGVLAEPAVRQ